jgi:hypothetical protein
MNARKYNLGETKRILNQEKDDEITRQTGELRNFLHTRPSWKEADVAASTCLTVRLVTALQAHLLMEHHVF